MTVLLFFFLIGIVFWITSLHERPERAAVPVPHRAPHPGADMAPATAHRQMGAVPGPSAQDAGGAS